MPYISVIVCTRNRAKSLESTLKSIELAVAEAKDLDIEAVIVDNGSTDETQDVLRHWAKQVSFPVFTPLENRQGLSHARNTGISTATGILLAFTDDDCRLSPDYFLVLDRYYRNDEYPIMRGGRVELGDSSDLPIGIKLDPKVHRMTHIDHPGNFIIGANMILHRQIIERVGVFDTRFGAGAAFIAAEETDYIYRCYINGVTVEYVPDLTVYHFHGRKDIASVARLNHGYHVGGGALYAKYFSRWHLLRHFYWDTRKWITSIWSGRLYDDRAGLSYWSVISGNLHGILVYARATLKIKAASSLHGSMGKLCRYVKR